MLLKPCHVNSVPWHSGIPQENTAFEPAVFVRRFLLCLIGITAYLHGHYLTMNEINVFLFITKAWKKLIFKITIDWPNMSCYSWQTGKTYLWLQFPNNWSVISQKPAFCIFSGTSCRQLKEGQQKKAPCLRSQLITMERPYLSQEPQVSWAKCWWKSFCAPALKWKQFIFL